MRKTEIAGRGQLMGLSTHLTLLCVYCCVCVHVRAHACGRSVFPDLCARG